MKQLKLTGIVLKQPQNGTETKVVNRRVGVSHFYSVYFPYFKLLHMIATFRYKRLNL